MARAQRRKFHYIYKTTCLTTGRYYIGMHSADRIDDGYLGSGKQLWNSIRKHGKENHRREVIEMFESREILRKREEELVDDDLLKDEMCMNIRRGGEGGWDFVNEHDLSPLQRPETMSAEVEKRTRQGNALGGTKSWEWRKKTGTPPPTFAGHRHSAERNKRAGEIISVKISGTKNGAFGSRWVHSLGSVRRCKVNELPMLLSSGWVLGRK